MLFSITYNAFYVLSIAGIMVTALLIYVQRKEPEHKFFAAFAIIISMWLALQFSAQLISTYWVFDSTFLLRLSVALSPFFAIYFFFFATEHIGKHLKKKVHYILPTLLATITIFTPFTVMSATASIDGITINDGILYYPLILIVIGYTLIATFYIFRESKAKKGISPSRRQANNLLTIGVLQAVILVFMSAVPFAEDSLSQIAIPFSLLVMVMIFGYAIFRHQLFDIRLIVARFFAYILLLLFMGSIYGFITVFISLSISGTAPDSRRVVISSVFVALLILFVEPLHKFFKNVTRKIFYQDDYDTKYVLDEIVSVLVRSSDTQTLAKDSLYTLKEALKSDFINLLVIDNKEKMTYKEISVGRSAPHIMSMQLNKVLPFINDVSILETEANQANDFHRSMQDANITLVMRLESKGDIVGYCFFGYKSTGSTYSHRDTDLIRIAGDEIAMAVQNTLRFEQIQEFNTTLQERIQEATKTLRNRNTQLQRLDEAKDEFVGLASHQLRTPLTSVKGYISMVLEGDAGKINAMQRQLLNEAFTSSERMVHLINDFLNVSRLQTGKFIIDQRSIDLSRIIEQEAESLKSTAKAHSLKIKYRPPTYFPTLFLDEGKIRQVIMNFIDNAIYYSRPGTTIEVKLYIDDGDAIVEVHDTGIGVPEAEREHLFTKFFRATNARKQRPDGTGVGLFLAKKVVVAHGGHIMFDSVEGEGSMFGFRLPIRKLSTKHPEQLEDEPDNDKDD
jgi:signal transduction histidine kinase